MHDNEAHRDSNGAGEGPKKDCGCGCAGNGDCEEARKPENRARRAFLLGTGTTVVATLINRRAFAQGVTCGPLSHAASLNPSGAQITSRCGGLTPGYWANSEDVAGKVLAQHLGGLSASDANACGSVLKTYLSKITLVSLLPALQTIGDPAADPNVTFCNVWAPPRDNSAFHWAAAILDALSPQYNPNYGYTLTSLNQAILNAWNSEVSAANIVAAIESLENDYGTGGPGGASGTNCKACLS